MRCPRKAASAGATYRVVRGDTLYAIAFRNGVDFRELAAWNGYRAAIPDLCRAGACASVPKRGAVGSHAVASAPVTPARARLTSQLHASARATGSGESERQAARRWNVRRRSGDDRQCRPEEATSAPQRRSVRSRRTFWRRQQRQPFRQSGTPGRSPGQSRCRRQRLSDGVAVNGASGLVMALAGQGSADRQLRGGRPDPPRHRHWRNGR
jgi:hypothetical protein